MDACCETKAEEINALRDKHRNVLTRFWPSMLSFSLSRSSPGCVAHSTALLADSLDMLRRLACVWVQSLCPLAQRGIESDGCNVERRHHGSVWFRSADRKRFYKMFAGGLSPPLKQWGSLVCSFYSETDCVFFCSFAIAPMISICARRGYVRAMTSSLMYPFCSRPEAWLISTPSGPTLSWAEPSSYCFSGPRSWS